MATIVLTDAKSYLGEFNVSGDMNHITVNYGADAKEDTAFGATFHTNKPGLRKATIHQEGYVQFGATTTTVDGRLYSKFAVADVPISVAAEGGDAGEVAFFMKALEAQYNLGAQVGEMLKFQIDAGASGTNVQLVKGTIMEDGKTARTTAGNSSSRALGAVSATQKLHAVLHVLAFTGTNVVIKVRSAVTDFATITDRITFLTVTAPTSEDPVPVAGAITDTFWRVDWTGTFTSFNAVVIVGIQ